jgi:diguanylate cyclase (GGDEF)-like protein/PAS domain S-box-containing protein
VENDGEANTGDDAPRPQEARVRPESVATVADRLVAPVTVVSPEGQILYANLAAAHAIGVEPSWVVGRQLLDLIHPEDRERISEQFGRIAVGRPTGGFTRCRIRGDESGDWRVFDSVVNNLIDDPTIDGILISSRDVTEQVVHEQQLFAAAYVDTLTGLPNRARVDVLLAELMGRGEPPAAAFIAIDRFTLINDSLGHAAGDRVIEVVAKRVRSTVPAHAIVGRYAGDLLVLLLFGSAAEDPRAVAWSVVERVSEPLFIAGHELRLSISAGVARATSSTTGDQLLSDADLALHEAVATGGGRVTVFEPHLRSAAVARLEIEANLRRAIDGTGLRLATQPIVRLDTRTPVRSEALLRWRHDGREIEPHEFIPVAEETGLVVPLGNWVIERAARLAPSAPGGALMVNLSARQLGAPGLPERIARTLAMHNLPASALGFEITETLVIEQFEYTRTVLRAIRELGCRVGLDDFGVGYSSLGYLRRLPLDFLKIDRSLISGIDSDTQCRAIVNSIIGMADALGLETIGEGVETHAESVVLESLGCTLAQGHLYGHPSEGE